MQYSRSSMIFRALAILSLGGSEGWRMQKQTRRHSGNCAKREESTLFCYSHFPRPYRLSARNFRKSRSLLYESSVTKFAHLSPKPEYSTMREIAGSHMRLFGK